MKVYKLTYGLIILLFVLVLTGCGASKPAAVQVDSGVINEQYRGNIQSSLPKEIKITEDEKKNGIRKVPIKASSAAREEAERNNTGQSGANNTGDGNAKPQI